MSSAEAVFVYGLLTFPDIVKAITGKTYPMQPASLADYKSYGVSQQPGETPVPALAPCANHLQQGYLLLDVGPAELDKLDFFEELNSGLYLRQKVRVCCAGQWLDAWCYIVGPALEPYLSGDWDVRQVSEEHKKQLITQLIPSMLTTYHKLDAQSGAKTKVSPLSED
jgi:gamma-glutamylcyclotransferase (GGCT)/AIG2-like uncharacterized protein YtfP